MLLSSAKWLIVALAALGLMVSVVNYFAPDNGIHGSLGAFIVVGSTALMLLASGAIALGSAGRVRGLLAFLIVVDILATGLAAYMLEADVLLGVMGLAFVAWLIRVFMPARPSGLSTTEVAS